ncbi:DUF2997 domain-containing protein [Micromonospora sp. NPDC006766]|uniref:DUF2997 domain-containing protein n=1 Tax=Micromonospora sp. NPDC006766 TaxID=3154778 RepID=UPI0033FF7002
MAEEILEVTISPQGKVEMHMRGVEGMACLAMTQQLVDLLGGDVESQELTAEAYVEVEGELQDQVWH